MRFLALLPSLLGLVGLPGLALAVPLQVAHQGELSDAGGPVTDAVGMTFALFAAENGGPPVWSETRSVDVIDGHYAVLLGSDLQSNPIEDVLAQEPALWLQVTIDSEPLLPRQPIGSTPYAIVADTAVNLDGGTVNASSISVNGNEVVDAGGAWAGGAGSVDWGALGGLPAGFADGIDGDALGGLSCDDGAVATYDSGTGLWNCGSDDVLSEAEVLSYIDGAVVDLGAGSTAGGVGLATLDDLDWDLLVDVPAGFADGIDQDTMGGVSCVWGQVPVSTGPSTWGCMYAEPLRSRASYYMRTASRVEFAQGINGVVALCDDAVDVPFMGGCTVEANYSALIGSGPAYEGQAWDTPSLGPTLSWSTGPARGGWGCRARGDPTNAPFTVTAAVVCVSIP